MQKLLFTLWLVLGVALAGKRIPLRRIKSVREIMMANGQWEEYANLKNRLAMANGPDDEPLKDYTDIEYVGEVDIGTPAQVFRVLMDTGIANLLVPSINCTMCEGKTRFDPGKSSTYRSSSLKMDCQSDGSCLGTIGYDRVCIAEVCVSDQPFGEITSMLYFPEQQIDGVCGLAFQICALDLVIPPVQNMIEQNLLDNPWFTIWMTADGNVQGKIGGELTLGDYDTTHCSASCDWVPLISATYYKFTLSGYRVDSAVNNHPRAASHRHRSAAVGSAAISDSGVGLIGGPAEDIDTICTQLGGVADRQRDFYMIPCDSFNLPDVIFTINGKDYPVSAKNYILSDGTGKCILGFTPHTLTGTNWVLGTGFIREYCNVYDMRNKRLGLCKATQ